MLALVLSSVALGPPHTPPPRVSGASISPPPAWIEAGSMTRWLAYGNYCWRTTCVDFLPPRERRLPVISAQRRSLVSIHLRFRPTTISVRVGSRMIATRPHISVSWRASVGGLITVQARGPGGSATYLASLRIQPAMASFRGTAPKTERKPPRAANSR
jgi:hypothetical protein